MSTISAIPDASTAQSPSDQGDLLIAEHLEAVRAAIWRSMLLGSILRLMAGILIFFLAFAVIDQWVWNVSLIWRLILGASAAAASAVWTVKKIVPLIRQRISREYAAFSIEMEAPELQHSLTSYVTLRDDREAPGIRGIVIRSIGSRAARFLTNSGMTMPRESGGSFQWSMIVIALSAIFAVYAIASPKNTLQSVRRLATPLAAIEAPTRTQIEDVTPGNAEALFGRPLKITAKIRGLSIDDQAFVEFVANRGSNEFVMPKSDESGLYETTIPSDWIAEDFTYHVVAGDSRSGPFQVTIRDLPAVVVNQVTYSPPAYTQLSRRSSNSGAIEGPEGTTVTLTATTNRKIAKGRIEFNPRTIQGQTSATAGFAPVEVSEDGLTLTATWNLQSTVRGGTQATIDSYRIHVWDETDVENTDPVIYPIRVINDLPPEVRIAVPEKSPKEVPLGTQQTIEVRSVDPDYGLTTVDLQIRRGTSIVKTIPLLNDEIGRRGNHVAAYRFRPDTLGLRSGDLVTVEAIARDNRYDVIAKKIASNRTVSEPVELKIIPSPPVPQNPDGDGLQPKDNQPATSTQNDDGGQSDQGQSEGGGGAGGESSEGQANKQNGAGGQGEGAGQSASENQPNPENQSQPNSGQGKGSGGESSENNNNPENNRDNGSGGDSQDPDQENPGDSRQSSGGDAEGQENNSEASDKNESPLGDDPASGSPSSDTGSDSGTSGDNTLPRNGENPQQQTLEQSPTDSGNDPNAGERSGTPLDSQETNGTESQSDQQDSQGADGDSRSDSRNPSNDSRAKSDTPHPPASSDGEAFERIRDYLNERSRETPSQRPNSTPQDGNKEPTEAQPSEGKEQEDATSTPESNPSPQSGDELTGSQQNSTNSDAASGAREGGKQSPNGNDKPLDNSQPNDSSDTSSAGNSPNENSQEGASGEKPEGEGNSNGSSEQTSGQASEQGDPSKDSNQNESQQNPKEGSGADPGESRGESEEGSENQGGQDSAEENRSGEDSSGNEDGKQGEQGDPSDQSKSGDQSKQGDQGKNGQPGSEASPDSKSSNDSASENSTGEASTDSQTGGGSSSDAPSNGTPGKESKSNASQSPNGDPTGGNSGGSFGEGERGKDAAPPADKIDLDAAKKATDLVLDALQHQREKPDQALLDELGWTPEQLRRFIDRWQGVKKLGEQTDPQSRQQFEEALQSLGLRPAGVSTERRSLDARKDRLNEIRDTGTRMQPPPQFRDAIEAFRRGVNK